MIFLTKDIIYNISIDTIKQKILWSKNITKTGIIYTGKINLDKKKKLLIKVYSKNNPKLSYLEIKMNNGIKIIRITKDLYSLITMLNYKVN